MFNENVLLLDNNKRSIETPEEYNNFLTQECQMTETFPLYIQVRHTFCLTKSIIDISCIK